jgi:hypothetical protein
MWLGNPAAFSASKGRKVRMMVRARLRDLGIAAGVLPTGRFNPITDVDGVKVGYLHAYP